MPKPTSIWYIKLTFVSISLEGHTLCGTLGTLRFFWIKSALQIKWIIIIIKTFKKIWDGPAEGICGFEVEEPSYGKSNQAEWKVDRKLNEAFCNILTDNTGKVWGS